MSSLPSLRDYTDADLSEVVALYTAAVHGLTGDHYTAAQRMAWAPLQPDLAGWRERLRGLRVLLAEERGVLAGFIAWDADGHIDLLFTAPACARRGVAGMLYARAEAALRAAGVGELRTEASLVARPFFEGQGFDVVEVEGVLRGGVSLRRFAMRKRLSAS